MASTVLDRTLQFIRRLAGLGMSHPGTDGQLLERFVQERVSIGLEVGHFVGQ
jgi:hypothetical protein